MEICGIKFAPLHVPFQRRMQTLAVTMLFLSKFFSSFVVIIGIPLTSKYIQYVWIFWIIYLFWIFIIDKGINERGGRPSTWVRSWLWWKYTRDYFPIRLEKLPSVELDPKKNYLFCSFPHGILGTGTVQAIGADYLNYNTYFPHHKSRYFATIPLLHYIPIFRDIILGLGAISVSAKSISYVLSKPGGGNVCALMVGGASEAYFSKPGSYKVVLRKRTGFVKLALKNGAPLVPVLAFGETDMYDQLESPFIRYIQDIVKKLTCIAPIAVIGRGIFQYSFGIIPYRVPINIVVGMPVDVPKIEIPTVDDVKMYHEKFVKALTELFEDQKYKYLDKPEEKKLIIV